MAYEQWMQAQVAEESSVRRKEMLLRGLSHSSVEFLRKIWYPVVGNFDHLYAEYEVRDLDNKLRYIDFAFRPGDEKGCIEIHDYRTHARDIEVSRFKDLCMKQAYLVLDDWDFLPIAYLSIRDQPEACKKLVLAFVGKYLSTTKPQGLNWSEAETVRFARRLHRPFVIHDVAEHLSVSDRQARRIVNELVESKRLVVASGNQRYRTYKLP